MDAREHIFTHTGTGAISEELEGSPVQPIRITAVHIEFDAPTTQDEIYFRRADSSDNVKEEYAESPYLDATATRFTWKPVAPVYILKTEKFVVAFANNDTLGIVTPECNIQYEVVE